MSMCSSDDLLAEVGLDPVSLVALTRDLSPLDPLLTTRLPLTLKKLRYKYHYLFI